MACKQIGSNDVAICQKTRGTIWPILCLCDGDEIGVRSATTSRTHTWLICIRTQVFHGEMRLRHWWNHGRGMIGSRWIVRFRGVPFLSFRMRKGLSDVTRRGRFIQDDVLCEDNASGECTRA